MPFLRNIIAVFSPRDRLVQRLYDDCVATARAAEHYGPGRVADSVDGRFDLLVLHLFVMARRLGAIGQAGDALVRSLIEAFIRDMERNLREMGAGDIGVAKRIKYMAQALHGQMQAYTRALDAGDSAMREALARTLFPDGNGGADPAAAQRLAAYVRAQIDAMAAQPDASCLAGRCRLLPAAEAYRTAETRAA